MVTNSRILQERGINNQSTLKDVAMELAELVLRAYEREAEKKGETKDDE